jgi:hypothetical protein
LPSSISSGYNYISYIFPTESSNNDSVLSGTDINPGSGDEPKGVKDQVEYRQSVRNLTTKQIKESPVLRQLFESHLSSMDPKAKPSAVSSTITSLEASSNTTGSTVASRRGVNMMPLEIPSKPNFTKDNILKDVNQSVELYKGQMDSFRSTIDKISKGQEKIYPSQATTLFRQYLELIPHLIDSFESLQKEIKSSEINDEEKKS